MLVVFIYGAVAVAHDPRRSTHHTSANSKTTARGLTNNSCDRAGDKIMLLCSQPGVVFVDCCSVVCPASSTCHTRPTKSRDTFATPSVVLSKKLASSSLLSITGDACSSAPVVESSLRDDCSSVPVAAFSVLPGSLSSPKNLAMWPSSSSDSSRSSQASTLGKCGEAGQSALT